jgi:hypothetical protein
MNPSYSGTAEDLMPVILGHLQQAVEGGPEREQHRFYAMMGLVGLYDRQAAEGPADPDAMRAFRARSAELLEQLGTHLANVVLDAEDLAESAVEGDEWPRLSMLRSAIQSLLDDYAGTGVPALIDPADVAELDERLRELAPEQEPVAEAELPRGLPDGHWWWRLPRQ